MADHIIISNANLSIYTLSPFAHCRVKIYIYFGSFVCTNTSKFDNFVGLSAAAPFGHIICYTHQQSNIARICFQRTIHNNMRQIQLCHFNLIVLLSFRTGLILLLIQNISELFHLFHVIVNTCHIPQVNILFAKYI